METSFHGLCVCVFQVILAYESIMLCKCSGNVLIGQQNFHTKIVLALKGLKIEWFTSVALKQRENSDKKTFKCLLKISIFFTSIF